VEELAPLAVVAVADLWVVELLAQLRHVVAWNVLFLLEFTSIVGKTTVFAKFAFSEMDHILAHFSFLLFLHIVVEFLPFLVIGKCFFQLFASSLTVLIPGRTSLITRAMICAS